MVSSKEVGLDFECPFVAFIPVELELSKGGVGDLRRSHAEVPKLIIACTVPGAAGAPVSMMPGLCSGAGGVHAPGWIAWLQVELSSLN
jgi:hypothetical protein